MTEVVLPTAGGCMRPWIWPNGQLHVQRCSMAELRIGDIAVWFDGKNLLSHRVVELAANVLITRGDSSPAVDSPAAPSQLLGRAVRFTKGPVSYRLDGPVVLWLSQAGLTPWVRLLSVARWGRDRLTRR